MRVRLAHGSLMDLMSWCSERERERERESERERAGDARNRINNRCFRTMILKLVNPLESLEGRIDFFVHP